MILVHKIPNMFPGIKILKMANIISLLAPRNTELPQLNNRKGIEISSRRFYFAMKV